ncbi:MAG: DUF1501 domain-containing protein, partial [Acidobacteria bacterium]|nr:DUF1501 domain-containing protein [Acidobacteriota bacterium]
AKNCFACHTASKLGGLEMASRGHLLKGGNSGPAIVPGKPDESLLIHAVRRTHARLKMPPDGKLTNEEVADLTAWVAAGAVWPELENKTPKPTSYVITPEQRAFWAFQPVRKPAVPKGKSAIDHFVLARLVHDLHATVLHCLGLDHTRLTYRYSGRDFRLTDVAGNVLREILA